MIYVNALVPKANGIPRHNTRNMRRRFAADGPVLPPWKKIDDFRRDYFDLSPTVLTAITR